MRLLFMKVETKHKAYLAFNISAKIFIKNLITFIEKPALISCP